LAREASEREGRCPIVNLLRCNGVPCYLHGAREPGVRLQELLGMGPGEPTRDGRLSWEWFACLG
jgi:NADH:ubiquinone oxidoreductase subunit E